MKKLLYALISATILAVSCDPPYDELWNTEFVKLKANISDTNEVISLGDTLKIYLSFPDTLVSNNFNTYVQSLQEARFYMHINKFDITNGHAILVQPPHYWLTKGSAAGNSWFYLSKNAKPYEVIINFKPTVKGIYYLEVVSQPGYLTINNNSYSANLVVGFSASSPHLNLIPDTIPGGRQNFINGVQQAIADGFGYYFFRVD